MAWVESYTTADRKTGRSKQMYAACWRENGHKKKQRGFQKKADATGYGIERERELRLGQLYEGKQFSLAEFAGLQVAQGRVIMTGEGWFADYRTRVEESTYDLARCTVPHLRPFLKLQFAQINPLQVQTWVTKMATTSGPRTAQRALQMLKAITRDAQTYKQRIDADILNVKPPKVSPRDHFYMTREQVAKLAQVSTESNLITFAAETGLRLGELFALRDQDIHLRGVTVRGTVYRGQRKSTTKTKESRRNVPLTQEAREALRRQMAQRAPGTDLIFPTPRGKTWLASNFYRDVWKPTVEASGLNDVRFHDLRHTFVSWLVDADAHPRVVQELCGHDDWDTTMKVYGHLFKGKTQSTIDLLDAARAREAQETGEDAAGAL